MPLNDTFASALRHYRESANLSQEELAEHSDLDRTYVSQLERGLKSPTLTTLQKIATCLGIEPNRLLRAPRGMSGPRVPADYVVASRKTIRVQRSANTVSLPSGVLSAAINHAHELIDDLYSIELDIASILGMRNLSAFIGELVAAAIIKSADGRLRPNPHQDGYPDLLFMDDAGQREWTRLEGRLNEKAPFSPFAGGGIEVKATCGSVPTPAVFRRRGTDRPGIGDTRIGNLTGYDWKAHHRQTNNLVGILWDFMDRKPRIAAMFYSSELTADDWGAIVQPRDGGGRTTSVSIMSRTGIQKMYRGWLCVARDGGYVEFLNNRNNARQIPAD